MKENELNNAIMSVIDCTERLQWECSMNRLTIPPIKRGNEKFTEIRKGTKIIASGKGPTKRGVKGKVIETGKNNGYNRYTVEWEDGRVSFEREQDIEKQ